MLFEEIKVNTKKVHKIPEVYINAGWDPVLGTSNIDPVFKFLIVDS